MKHQLTIAASLCALVLTTACSSQTDEPAPQGSTIRATVEQKEVWSTPNRAPMMGTRAYDADDLFFGFYLYGPDGNRISTKADLTSKGMTSTLSGIIATGTHTLYGITQWPYSAIANYLTVSPTDELPLTLTDIHLGSQTIDVVAGTNTYVTTVTAEPIMSKLALSITDVPSNISSVTATLPSQASKFTLTGTLVGNDQSQVLPLTKSGSTWSIEETLVYPSATDSENMPITIQFSDGTHTSTYNTSTTQYQCVKGSRVSLTAAYSGVTLSGGIQESGWTGTITSGTISLGNPNIE